MAVIRSIKSQGWIDCMTSASIFRTLYLYIPSPSLCFDTVSRGWVSGVNTAICIAGFTAHLAFCTHSKHCCGTFMDNSEMERLDFCPVLLYHLFYIIETLPHIQLHACYVKLYCSQYCMKPLRSIEIFVQPANHARK